MPYRNEDGFVLVNSDGQYELNIDENLYAKKHSTKNLLNGTNYWLLPTIFTGNQTLLYGGNINFALENLVAGDYVPDDDVIMTGNYLRTTLYWTRGNKDYRVSTDFLYYFLITMMITLFYPQTSPI